MKCGECHEEGSKQHLQTEDSKRNTLETGRVSERMSLGLRVQHAEPWVLHMLPSGSETQADFLAQSRCSVNFNARGMSK